MTNKARREQVKEHILDFSSKEIQYEAWFVSTKIRSTADEDFCMLFDDLGIEDYVYAKDNYMTKQENNELKELINMLNEYKDKHSNTKGFADFDSETVYNDPVWEKIRQQAKKLYNILEKENGIEELTFVDDWTY